MIGTKHIKTTFKDFIDTKKIPVDAFVEIALSVIIPFIIKLITEIISPDKYATVNSS
jgi:hypothetical protein